MELTYLDLFLEDVGNRHRKLYRLFTEDDTDENDSEENEILLQKSP